MDIETTGMSLATDEIIEIGAIKVTQEMEDTEEIVETFHSYCRTVTSLYMDPKAQAVHGLTLEFLADKPRLPDVLRKFLFFVEDYPIAIHNVNFDWNFLQRDLQKHHLPFLTNERICTMAIARKFHTNSNCSLDKLSKIYGINTWHRFYHGALIDANILKDLYYILIAKQIKPLAADILEGAQIGNHRLKPKRKGFAWKEFRDFRRNPLEDTEEATDLIAHEILCFLKK